MHRSVFLIAAAAAMPAFAAGCAARGSSPPAPAAEAAAATERPTGRSTEELNELYRARADSARLRFTAADVHFMTIMIAHHAQAILMAELAATRGVSAPVATLAARIISAQRDEIELMQSWLRERGQPVPEPHIQGTTLMMHGAGVDHVMDDMPGMISEAQLAELERARGEDFDRLLLLHMIEHHRGAVAMVRELFASPGAARDPLLFRFAADVQADQLVEITRMMRLLAELPDPSAVRP